MIELKNSVHRPAWTTYDLEAYKNLYLTKGVVKNYYAKKSKQNKKIHLEETVK